MVSSADVLTDALTFVPSPTDRDAMDLKKTTKFTAYRKLKGGELSALTNSNTICINTFLCRLSFSKNCSPFKFSSKTKFRGSLKAHGCRIISQRVILKYDQQQDINRLLGCLSGADKVLRPQRTLMTLTTYFMWANQSHEN